MMRGVERSLKRLREMGGYVARVEKWNQFAHIRQDMFGIFDLVWLNMHACKIVGIQVVNTHLPEHIDKIKTSPEALAWLRCGGRIQIHQWRKLNGSGKRAVWTLTVLEDEIWK